MTEQAAAQRPGISAAIVGHENRVLMVRRRICEGQLFWQFPAGEIEDGETSEEAAIRETYEEVGLKVTAARSLGGRVHPKSGRNMSYTACTVASGTAYVADTDELAELKWLRWPTSRSSFPTASSSRYRCISTTC